MTKPLLIALAALAFAITGISPALAQGNQCRTAPVGTSTPNCASEAYVVKSLEAAPQGTVTEQKNTAGAGLATSGNCDNTGTNAASPCRYAFALNNAVLQANPGNPSGTNNAAATMMGLGSTCKLTPVYATRVRVAFFGQVINTGAGGTTALQVRWGTGTPPANGATTGIGTQVGNNQTYTAAGASDPVPFANGGILTGLTVGTQIWADMALFTGGTSGSIANISCNLEEF